MRFYRLDLNHLVTLEVLLVERSLTRAAERLHLTQPAISNALTKLRDHFDDDLLVRRGRDMECTPFAESLLAPLQDTLRRIRGIALAKPGFDPSTASREFKIVASDYVATVFLTDLIHRVAQVAPNITISHIPISQESISQFDHHEADALIFPDGQLRFPQHPKQALFSEGWTCIARNDNPVPDTITAEAYFALARVTPPFPHYVVDRDREYAFSKPPIALPFSAIPWFVARSDYIAVIPERLADMYAAVLPLKRIKIQLEMKRIAFIVQWHAGMMEDPFEIWMLEQLQAVGNTLEPKLLVA